MAIDFLNELTSGRREEGASPLINRGAHIEVGSDGMNRLYHHWDSLTSIGLRYPLWLLKKAMFGRQRNRRTLDKFTGRGLEIGGPSQFFQPRGEFPIYSVAQNIDNVNYSLRTFWEGQLQEGRNFKYKGDKSPGHQFIREASDLSNVTASTYDFVASSHTLEHCANPIKALNEWRRVLRVDGWLVLVIPHRLATFDHRRGVTRFEHLLEDYRADVTEDDTTHFAEILQKHDLARDSAQKSREAFEQWIRGNAANRGAHHHVFDPLLAITLVDYMGFEVVIAEIMLPHHIFIVAQKSDKSQRDKEEALVQIVQDCCLRSPFKSDRRKHDLADLFSERDVAVAASREARL
jgi:SAM-dependent methyltransferase